MLNAYAQAYAYAYAYALCLGSAFFYGWQVNLLENSFMTNQFLEKSYSLFTITDNEWNHKKSATWS